MHIDDKDRICNQKHTSRPRKDSRHTQHKGEGGAGMQRRSPPYRDEALTKRAPWCDGGGAVEHIERVASPDALQTPHYTQPRRRHPSPTASIAAAALAPPPDPSAAAAPVDPVYLRWSHLPASNHNPPPQPPVRDDVGRRKRKMYTTFNSRRRPTIISLDLLAEGAALGQPGLAARRLAQHGTARAAQHNGLRMREDGGDVEAAGALHVHEEGVRGLHQALQLVPALLQLARRVQQVNVTHGDERHAELCKADRPWNRVAHEGCKYNGICGFLREICNC